MKTNIFSRKGAKGAKNNKFKARNPKQIQMIQRLQNQNEPKSDSRFWIFRIWDLFWSRFVSDLDIRISDLLLLASLRHCSEQAWCEKHTTLSQFAYE